jgi:hypothetical protein
MKKFDDITEPEDFNPEEMQLEFAPGCFDDFEGTQEDLDALVEHIKEMFVAGKFVTEGRELTDEDFDTLSESTKQKIIGLQDAHQPKRNLN